MTDRQLIEPERQGVWLVATFVIAIVALLLSAVGFYRTNQVMVGTLVEIASLNKKIELVQQQQAPVVAEAKAPEVGKK